MSFSDAPLASFITGAPPGEVLSEGNASLLRGVDKYLAKHEVDEFRAVALPGGKRSVLSKFNQLDQDTFFDAVAGVKFKFDHQVGKPIELTDYESDSTYDFKSLAISVQKYLDSHFPSDSSSGVFPQPDGTIAIVLLDTKYNPSNFWNGKWKSWYILDPSSGDLNGSIDIDVHYYEDGNVRLNTSKKVQISAGSGASASTIVSSVSKAETQYQEQVNHTFIGLNTGSFKALRRQLPVTRSKINWGGSIGTYRLGQGKCDVSSYID